MKNPRFSGHETFHCKSFWLKKGYDFSRNNSSFRDTDAVVQLGVGKNMVSSISHWLSVFNILNDEGGFSQVGSAILDNEGFDPYMEDIGTIWFLHFQLLKKEYASLYPLFFKDFRRTRISGEFNSTQNYTLIFASCREIRDFDNFIEKNTALTFYEQTLQITNFKFLIKYGYFQNGKSNSKKHVTR